MQTEMRYKRAWKQSAIQRKKGGGGGEETERFQRNIRLQSNWKKERVEKQTSIRHFLDRCSHTRLCKDAFSEPEVEEPEVELWEPEVEVLEKMENGYELQVFKAITHLPSFIALTNWILRRPMIEFLLEKGTNIERYKEKDIKRTLSSRRRWRNNRSCNRNYDTRWSRRWSRRSEWRSLSIRQHRRSRRRSTITRWRLIKRYTRWNWRRMRCTRLGFHLIRRIRLYQTRRKEY